MMYCDDDRRCHGSQDTTHRSTPREAAYYVADDASSSSSDISGSSTSSGSSSDSDDGSSPPGPALYSPADVIRRIEGVARSVVDTLHAGAEPVLASSSASASSNNSRPASSDQTAGGGSGSSSSNEVTKQFNLSQCRSFTNVMLVLSFVHSLLLSKRTTTTREVYYYHVTHFRSQRECDAAILDAANLLRVPRISLGLAASPKGWYCGCIEITRPAAANTHGPGSGPDQQPAETTIDGTALSSIQGLPITREWIDRSSSASSAAAQAHRGRRNAANRRRHRSNAADNGGATVANEASSFCISSKNAKCILVIEKEGVYTRLSEDRFYDRYPCILVTGKGYPDLATRALVHTLHTELDQLPVYGLCDCNPFGVSVLQTYQRGSERMGLDGGSRYGVPILWAGLRPSQLLRIRGELPRDVFQNLTDRDRKKAEKLGHETSPFLNAPNGERRREELEEMAKLGCKVELESLHWLGMDYMCDWLEEVLVGHDEEEEAGESGGESDEGSDEEKEWHII